MLSIVLTNRNRVSDRILEACFCSYKEQDYTGPIELIVMDNGSTDGSPEVIEQILEDLDLSGKVVRMGGNGEGWLGRGVNESLPHIHGDAVMVSSTDFYLRPDALSLLTAPEVLTTGAGYPYNYWMMLKWLQHEPKQAMIDGIQTEFVRRITEKDFKGGWEYLTSLPGFWDWPLDGHVSPYVPGESSARYAEKHCLHHDVFEILSLTKENLLKLMPFPLRNRHSDPTNTGHRDIEDWLNHTSDTKKVPLVRFDKPLMIHLFHERPSGEGY